MDSAALNDVLTYYERHFASGLADLSESSPPPVGLPRAESVYSLAYQGPDGALSLRRSIAARYETMSEDDIVVTCGAAEALATVAISTLGPGGRVFIGSGAYPTFSAIADLLQAVRVDSPAAADVILLTNPVVPSGRLLDVEGQIARSEQTGARVVVDEVYRELALSGRRARAACDLATNAVSIGDLSKPLGLGGLRIGWVASRDRQLLDRVRRNQQLLSGGPAAPSLAIAQQAIVAFDDLAQPLLDAARPLAARTYAVLREHRWTYEESRAGLTVLARPPRPLNESGLQRLREAGWFLLPSEVFGIPGGFRISLLQPDALRAALAWIEDTLIQGTSAESLIVLTKNPGGGDAKTRLASTVGSETAAAFAHAFVRDTLSLAASGPWRTSVAVPAPGADGWLRNLAPAAHFEEQAPGDLGTRIAAAIANELQHAARVVLVASDTPDLPREFIVRAFAEVRSADIVVGPSLDGGFYLIGATASHAGLFDGVAWSTDAVCRQLLANAQRLGLRSALLPEWDDVDDFESLSRLASRLEGGATAPASRAVLRSWREEPVHGS